MECECSLDLHEEESQNRGVSSRVLTRSDWEASRPTVYCCGTCFQNNNSNPPVVVVTVVVVDVVVVLVVVVSDISSLISSSSSSFSLVTSCFQAQLISWLVSRNYCPSTLIDRTTSSLEVRGTNHPTTLHRFCVSLFSSQFVLETSLARE